MGSALVATFSVLPPAVAGLLTAGTVTVTGSPAATLTSTGSVITAVVPVTVTAPHPAVQDAAHRRRRCSRRRPAPAVWSRPGQARVIVEVPPVRALGEAKFTV